MPDMPSACSLKEAGLLLKGRVLSVHVGKLLPLADVGKPPGGKMASPRIVLTWMLIPGRYIMIDCTDC